MSRSINFMITDGDAKIADLGNGFYPLTLRDYFGDGDDSYLGVYNMPENETISLFNLKGVSNERFDAKYLKIYSLKYLIDLEKEAAKKQKKKIKKISRNEISEEFEEELEYLRENLEDKKYLIKKLTELKTIAYYEARKNDVDEIKIPELKIVFWIY